MNFDLSEEQVAFRDALETFLADLFPKARLLETYGSGTPDLAGFAALSEFGALGVYVPETYGGLGLSALDLAVVAECVGYAAAPGPFLEHAVATAAITLCGSPAQREAWLPGLASGQRRATFAFAEEGGSWLAQDWRLDGGKSLTGVKRYVLSPEDVDVLIVGLAGGRLALVEPRNGQVDLRGQPCSDGGRTIGDVSFSAVPFELLAVPGGARICDLALILLAAEAWGGASRCLEDTVAYLREREQFGRALASFQAIKHQLADMAVAVQPARGLYWYAAHAFDHEPVASAAAAAMAKSHICQAYADVSRRAIELYGGIGYTWEFGAHIWLKRAVFTRTLMGSPSLHQLRYAELVGW